jgi:two-component system, OmpR family, sensor kinase
VSLRALLVAAVAVVALMLGVTGWVVVRTTDADLVDQVDQRLAAAEDPVRRLFGGRRGPPPSAEGLTDLYVGVVTADGAVGDVVEPVLTGGGSTLPEVPVDELREAADTGRAVTLAGRDGDGRFRATALPAGAFGDDVVVVALPLDDVDAAVDRLLAVQLVASATVIGLLALVTWGVVRFGVRPLRAMTAAASRIAVGDLSERVPEAEPGTEAGDLGVALNRMLASIEDAFAQRAASEERLRRFVADASHELRTPVATIRGYAELYRAGALGEEPELAEAMRRTEQEAVRMGGLVDDLLHLAHLDQGRPLERQPVDLATVAADAVRDALARQPERPVTAVVADHLVIPGDEARLRQVVANLVGNALVHTPPDAPVEVRVARGEDVAVVEVADGGPGMAPEVAARAFERFYRADAARSRHRGGTGLGLAIVAATVAAHAGRATLTSEEGAGTVVRLELPLGD